MKLELPTTKVTYKLPSILSIDEVQSIIKATGNIKHKLLLIILYGTGLRVSEAVNLRIADIDSKRVHLPTMSFLERAQDILQLVLHTAFIKKQKN